MKSKSRKGSGKKTVKKKKQVVYQSKYPILDMEKLKQVPVLNWVARMNNTKAGDIIEGTVPMDYSFNKIKEKIQERTVQYEKLIADSKFRNIQYKLIQDYKTDTTISDLENILYDIIEKAVPKTIVIAESKEEKEMLNALF